MPLPDPKDALGFAESDDLLLSEFSMLGRIHTDVMHTTKPTWSCRILEPCRALQVVRIPAGIVAQLRLTPYEMSRHQLAAWSMNVSEREEEQHHRRRVQLPQSP